MMNTPGMQYFPSLEDASIEASLDSWCTACPGMGVLALLPEAERGGGERLQVICARRRVATTFAGALSLGEIGSSLQWGDPLFHNATLVAACWDKG